MEESWRLLLYPLGFIASFLFGIRFIIQWISSEKKKKSYIKPSFWVTSFLANVLMAIHTFLQGQYPFCIIQSCNAVLAWRNLELMGFKKNCGSIRKTIYLLLLAIFLPTVSFIIEGLFLYGKVDWIRTPSLPWSQYAGSSVTFGWHLAGFFGAALFALRFWLQWWQAEKHKTSYLSPSFWWISLIGALLAFTYFLKINDWVNIIGYGAGIIPYIRNIILIKKSQQAQSENV